MSIDSENAITTGDITKKIMMVLGITLILMIPLLQVQCQIDDRRGYETKAQSEISKSWGGSVEIYSPLFQNTSIEMYPTDSETNVTIDTKEKKRGVFKVPVYSAVLKQKINFKGAKEVKRKNEVSHNMNDDVTKVSQKVALKPNIDVIKNEAKHLLIPVSPVSAIQSFKITNEKGQPIEATVASEGITFKIPEIEYAKFANSGLNVEITVRGTGTIQYITSVSQDHVVFQGNWRKPKYLNDELPSESKLNANGFSAAWSIHNLPNAEGRMGDSKRLGLDNLWASSDYVKIERAVKYGVLLIILTFLMIFLMEVFVAVKIHPLQYGLIGLSLCIFYLLLLAVSEVIGFDLAYITATVAVVALILFYFKGFVADRTCVTWMAVEQFLLSGFFYLLLSLEERALLIGTLGLFAILTVLMTATRRIDWYSGVTKKS